MAPEGELDQSETWGFDGDDLEVRVARAMYGAAIERVRQHASEIDLRRDYVEKVLTTAIAESDRSAAILIFALVEDLMLDAFKRYLSASCIKGGWSEVIGGNGLLATANDRITLACLLGWIRPAVYADLRILKSIRNRFAHHAQIEGFSDGSVQSWISALNITEEPAVDSFRASGFCISESFSLREKYLMRASLVATELLTDLAIAPHARQTMVSPGHVGGPWENVPDNIKDIRRIAARIIGDIIQKKLP
ncbi:hypothetical protein [Bosea beijingensis]|uniref:hypothetical protein n=1 Tax=Bosea beijingensis TaxID=3068632 RepID=UPI002740B4A0|nr:hypothetical protein [Bosea sp. REN20]